MQINLHKSDSCLSQLIERVIAGEEIIIGSDAGEPMAKIVPYQQKNPPRRILGVWKGKVKIADDFDEIPAEIAEAFGINNK